MFNKYIKAIAIDKITKERYIVSMICFPLGSTSGKDVAVVVSKDDKELTEWMSIDEVDIDIELVGDKR
jgi:hypothetical protein